MKRKIANILFGILFLIGFGILIYPTVSDQWNTYRQNQLISSYENQVSDLTEEVSYRIWNPDLSYSFRSVEYIQTESADFKL